MLIAHLVLAIVLAAGLLGAAPSPDPDATVGCLDPDSIYCEIGVGVGGSEDGGGEADPVSGFTPGPVECTSNYTDPSAVMECETDLGWWSNSRQCYVDLRDEQDAVPAERGAGAWYDCIPPFIVCDDVVEECFLVSAPFWAETPPPGVDTFTPGQAAQHLVSSFTLEGIDIGFAPDPTIADSKSYVGVPIWMWVDNPTPTTFGPFTQTAGLGGVEITVTATVTSVLWQMGDGTTVPCAGVGTAFEVGFGAVDSPTCGHRYAQTSNDEPGGSYAVEALSQWQIDWEGAGQSGSIPRTATSETTVDINELQSVNVG